MSAALKGIGNVPVERYGRDAMEKKPFVLSTGTKRPLMILIGNRRYQLQVETRLVPLSSEPAQIVSIDRHQPKAKVARRENADSVSTKE